MSTSPDFRGGDEDGWVRSRNIFDNRMTAEKLDLMSNKSLIQIWCERVQNDSIGLSPAPIQFQYISFERANPQESAVIDRKRRRPLSDVDGGFSESKKKRRLRLRLITSRLSRPFSYPATYIYDRDRTKTAWARKSMARDMMWKAAMVNCFRLRTLAAQHKMAVEQQRRQNSRALLPSSARPRPALRPSPLRQSHGNAAGLEDEGDGNDSGYEEDNEFDSDEEDSVGDPYEDERDR